MKVIENGHILNIYSHVKNAKPTLGSLSKKPKKLDLISSLERGWNSRFFVTYSKDNKDFHKSQREYFDLNKRFDKYYRDKFEERDAIVRVVNNNKPNQIKNRKILGSSRTHTNILKKDARKSNRDSIEVVDSKGSKGSKGNKGKMQKKISIIEIG
ncbi:hypothetical protein SteCoe_26939 [Stentor coeruleus]|uniref:Uncharacterized protein n=1 Tax=Stentor coeruleus TaxID=5963 RepID=A0A1R2BBQ9_9CILI|nr:hypothetical protein SteCoe_26939 [Stentor coeruleus]